MAPSDWLTNSFIQNVTNPDILPCSCFNNSSHQNAIVLWCSPRVKVSDVLIGQGDDLYEQVTLPHSL